MFPVSIVVYNYYMNSAIIIIQLSLRRIFTPNEQYNIDKLI